MRTPTSVHASKDGLFFYYLTVIKSRFTLPILNITKDLIMHRVLAYLKMAAIMHSSSRKIMLRRVNLGRAMYSNQHKLIEQQFIFQYMYGSYNLNSVYFQHSHGKRAHPRDTELRFFNMERFLTLDSPVRFQNKSCRMTTHSSPIPPQSPIFIEIIFKY